MRVLLRMLAPAVAMLVVVGCNPPKETAGPADATRDAAEVVKNVDAKPGDTTTCPFSGRPFVVKAEHPKVEHAGAEYWICSEDAAEKVRADPGKYLDDFDG